MTKVLIVDDSMYIRSLIVDMLSETEYETAQAENAEDMFRLLDDHQPDVIIIDIILPGINGLEALEVLHAKRPGVKVIVCSAQSSETIKAQAFEKGAAGYIQKPFGVDILKNALSEALK